MHICHCYKNYFPRVGGVENVILELSKAQIKAGHKVTILVSALNGSPANENLDGVEIIRTRSIFSIFKVPIMPSYYRHLCLINPDIVHVHGTVPGVSDIGVFYALRHNKRSVFHYHFDGNADSVIGTLFANIYNNSINIFTVNKADKVIALNKAYAETSPVLIHRINDLEIVPNGVDLIKFSPGAKERDILEKYGIQDARTILYVGRLIGYKGLEYLIRAMKNIKDTILLLVGSGPQEKFLRSLIDVQNIKNIRFIGSLPQHELPQLYRSCDIYAQPAITRGDTFPLSVLEAMACGLPIIYSDLPGTHKMVTDECGIKVKPKDIIGLAASINEISSNDALKLKMGTASRKSAATYSWDSITRRVLEIYQELSV